MSRYNVNHRMTYQDGAKPRHMKGNLVDTWKPGLVASYVYYPGRKEVRIVNRIDRVFIASAKEAILAHYSTGFYARQA